MIRNKASGLEMMYTTVYGPTKANLKINFWLELQHIRNLNNLTWLIGEAINVIRYRNEKKDSLLIIQ
jgi:hypothetical protein